MSHFYSFPLDSARLRVSYASGELWVGRNERTLDMAREKRVRRCNYTDTGLV